MLSSPARLRVAAINFLNPAPLMWDFEHPPLQQELLQRYSLRYTAPAACAAALHEGSADLGLIPIAALTRDLAIVPGCTIASRREVRSILLLVRQHAAATLQQVRTVAADTASRSSVAYTQILFRHFLGTQPRFVDAPASPIAMLQQADAALLIGDPALLAREQRGAIEAAVGPCLWLDLAAEWHARTGLPWVAAVWAVRRSAVTGLSGGAPRLIEDLLQSRDHGLANVEALVAEWSGRLPLPATVIRTYLTENIHYLLDDECRRAILLFRELSASIGILPPLPDPVYLA